MDEESTKELLIILINVVKAPIIASSESEYMKWAKEYTDTLLFSFENKEEFTEYH